MNQEKQNAFGAWLAGRIADCTQRQKTLQADDRMDEANFEKIRSNVYDIFRTILAVGGKTCGDDGVGDFFQTKVRQIPSSWETSLKQAELHGDQEKAKIEEIKLNAVREIKEKFSEIWEGAE